MPSYIVKLENDENTWYLEWSTVIDAPETFGMTYVQFVQYYRKRYGSEGMYDLADRMARVQDNGLSAMPYLYTGVDELLTGNRAGLNETCFTKEQIIEWYCVKRQKPQVEGTRFTDDEE